MRIKMKPIAAATAAVLLSAGCASTNTANIHSKVEEDSVEAAKAMDLLRAAKPLEQATQVASVRRVNAVWIPVTRVNEDDQRTLPALNRSVVVNRNFTSLKDAASYVTLLTGVPVAVADMPSDPGADTADPAAPGAGTAGPAAPGLAAPDIMPTNGGVDISGFVSYNGKLAGLLDVIAARFGVYWEPEGDGVRFFRTKSRTFRLAALPGDSSMNSKIGTSGGNNSSSGGGASGGAGTAQLNSGVDFAGLSVWDAIKDGIKTMLTPLGRVVVTPASGTITVDDTPPSLKRIEKYVRDQNAALTRQVVINVRVLSIELNDSDSYGVNWDAVYQNIKRGFGVSLNSTSGLPSGHSTLSFSVIDTNSMWNGTEAILEALSKQGRVSQITSASIVTINNQPAPIQVGRQRSYLASSTTTIGTGGAGNTTTLVPGIVTTGFSMSVLPHILDDGQLMLQYAGDISSLVGISTVTSNESSIQTPEIDTRNFLQRVMMKSGETLVLTGFEQLEKSGNKQGIGNPDNLIFGGSTRSSKNKTVLVVMIQPVISTGEH